MEISITAQHSWILTLWCSRLSLMVNWLQYTGNHFYSQCSTGTNVSGCFKLICLVPTGDKDCNYLWHEVSLLELTGGTAALPGFQSSGGGAENHPAADCRNQLQGRAIPGYLQLWHSQWEHQGMNKSSNALCGSLWATRRWFLHYVSVCMSRSLTQNTRNNVLTLHCGVLVAGSLALTHGHLTARGTLKRDE